MTIRMKIIDFERKGNVVRFYLGDDDREDYWGDDWDDVSYEDNAERVYAEYVRGYKDMSFPFDALVMEPSSNEYASHYSKEDMKKRNVPCIIVIPEDIVLQNTKHGGWIDDRFSHWVGSAHAKRFYFGDPMEPDVILQDDPQDNI